MCISFICLLMVFGNCWFVLIWLLLLLFGFCLLIVCVRFGGFLVYRFCLLFCVLILVGVVLFTFRRCLLDVCCCC